MHPIVRNKRNVTMKILTGFAFSILAIILSTITLEASEIPRTLAPEKLHDLKVDSPHITVGIPNPGSTSNICGVRFLVSPGPNEHNFNLLNLKLTSVNTSQPLKRPTEGRGIVEFVLPDEVLNNFFEDHVTIETVDGSSLKSVVENVIGKRGTIFITSSSCD